MPMTGRSRRAIVVLVLLLGAAAVAVVTALGRGTEEPCPDERYGCVELSRDEPMGLGVLFPEGEPGRSGVEELVRSREQLLDHRLEVVSFDGRCSAEGAATAAREFATQPKEGPAVVAVVGESCPEAEITAARILDDSGITLVSVLTPSDVPRTVSFHLGWADPRVADGSSELRGTDRAAFEVARTILSAVARVAVEDGEELLVPRTQLRDALLEAGLTRAP
jgi:hypothetical protein